MVQNPLSSATPHAAPFVGVDIVRLGINTPSENTSAVTGTVVEDCRVVIEVFEVVHAFRLVDDLVELRQLLSAKDGLVMEKLGRSGC